MTSTKPKISAPEDRHAAIRDAVRRIPRSCVASYGEIARRAGLPGRARLVGRVLGEADAAQALPWHRVLRADGRLAFAPGSRAFREQKRRLADEGVVVIGARVDLSRFGGPHDLDAELWAPPPRSAARRG